MDSSVISFVHAVIANERTNDYWDVDVPGMAHQDEQEVGYAILEVCGLLTLIETGMFPVASEAWSVSLKYYLITPLGQHFAVACRMVAKDADT